MTEERRAELAEEWQARARAFDAIARTFRREGDPVCAEEAETVAADYRTAAAELELERSLA